MKYYLTLTKRICFHIYDFHNKVTLITFVCLIDQVKLVISSNFSLDIHSSQKAIILSRVTS